MPAAIVARELNVRMIETVCVVSYRDYKAQGELSVLKGIAPEVAALHAKGKRVLIVDDHPIVRQGLRRIMENEEDLIVCGEAETARDARTAIKDLNPDVMIADISLKQSDGIELVRDRESKQPATEEGRAIGKACFEQGLIFSLRRGGSVLRFVPPATTTPDQIDQAMDLLGTVMEAVSTGHG